jgi:hypothetical protein
MALCTFKPQDFCVATALALLAGCQVEPPPPCLVRPATGFVTYVAQYTNPSVTSRNPSDADCALFTTTVPRSTWNLGPGVPNYLYPLGGQLGGRPISVDVIGLDKFSPTTLGRPSQVSIAPDILGGTSGAGTSPDGGAPPPGTAFGIAPFEAEEPDAQGLCYVLDFPSFGAPVDWGAGIGQRPVTFHFSNFVIYVTAAAPGTQFQVNAEITIGACTATFNVIAYAPAATCVIVDADGLASGPSSGVQPLNSADTDPGLCANSSPDSSDLQWTYYETHGYTSGDMVNRYFPIACDTPSGYCALPLPAAPTVPTVPIISSAPRP